jgi:DNA-binding beta-propeller fold protein YncE
MLAKKAGVFFLISLMVMFAGPSALAEIVDYTTDADFEQGTLVDVNYDPPNNDQLQLDTTGTPFAFVNVAATGRGTIVRINAETGITIGEYRTAPEGLNASPSRTSVDSLGNVWTANRDIFAEQEGSVVKIGIVVGGTRVNIDASGETISDDNGDYLEGPFDYNTCIDRDGDGLIRTSRGLGDILSWPATTDAEDECILIFQQLGVVGEEFHVSVDADNDVWVGQYPPGMFYKLDGDTGAVMSSFNAGTIGCGGWGGLVDGSGILWSASFEENGILYYDPTTESGDCIEYATGTNPWGLGIDSNGFIWNGLFSTNQIAKVDPIVFSIVDGFPKTSDPLLAVPQGVAVTPSNNNIWVANSGNSEVLRLEENDDGSISGLSIAVGQIPTGIAVDANGKVWVTNLTDNTVMRIDPDTGDGVIDLTVDLGDGADPDNYGNMTGAVPFSETATEGSWTIITDSGTLDHSWDTIVWNTEPEASEPEGTSITVEARAANTQAGLADEVYIEISNDVPFSLTGQFIEIRVTLMANDAGISPVLSNLAVDIKTAPESGKVCDIDENGIVDFRDIKGIFYSLGDTADGPDDPRDWNRDGMITKIDARGCIHECTNKYCAPSGIEEPCLEEDRQTEKHRRSHIRWYPTKRWRGQLYRYAERH